MKIRKKCLSCKKNYLSEIINLGIHSFADRFVPKKKISKKDPSYPLILDFCTKCNFIQSRIITNPKDRYLEIDYSYTSSNSEYSRSHWTSFTEYLEKKFKIKNKKILEIGSNDGFLCNLLNKKGAYSVGVDASKFMVDLSRKRNVKSINSIFDSNESKKIKKKYGLFDLIIANNVFNHSDLPSDFLKGVYNLLNKDGLYIFEQPDFAVGAVSLKFDQIYHEHVSYFTSKNIKSILKNNKFKVIDIQSNEYHGGSLRSIAVKTKSNKWNNKFKLSKYNKYDKIYKLKFYKKMMEKIDKKKFLLKKKIYLLKNEGYTICGIGAGAKSNTFLTYYSLNNKIIKFLTDASKFKQGKFTPLTRIPIKDDIEITNYKKIACIILSWNISNLVIKKIKKLNKKIKIIYT